MAEIKVSEFRQHIHSMLQKVQDGQELRLTRRGKVIAVVSPPQDKREAARRRLSELMGHARIGDIVSPIREVWEADNAGS